MKVAEWIYHHKKLGNLNENTGTRVINILNRSGAIYMHELEDGELRRFKGCGKKTFELWNTLKNVDYWSRHLPRLYRMSHRMSQEKYRLEERISELAVENSRLERALANEKHFNSKTNYTSLRKKLINDNKIK